MDSCLEALEGGTVIEGCHAKYQQCRITLHLNYPHGQTRCGLAEGATTFGPPKNSALTKIVGPRSSALREPILRSHPNGERSTTGHLPNARQSKGSGSYFKPNKIGPATPYDFDSKKLTGYGGLCP